ncbi:hypothetical protein L484_009431 [Morus notabilis]|uniref:Uncharacterized protein n=1 Tax=Morus notabilis TaxID=981085 RepID=W9QCX7_9ROSA|nr:hypothetical protein L484_009431 [Morus notabilis]
MPSLSEKVKFRGSDLREVVDRESFEGTCRCEKENGSETASDPKRFSDLPIYGLVDPPPNAVICKRGSEDGRT